MDPLLKNMNPPCLTVDVDLFNSDTGITMVPSVCICVDEVVVVALVATVALVVEMH